MESAMASGRRRTVDEGTLHVTSVFQKTGDHAVLDHVADADEEVLVALGYKQEFKRCRRPGDFLMHCLLMPSTGISPSCQPFPYHSQFWDFYLRLHLP